MALDRNTGKAVVLEQRALLNWAAVAADVRSIVDNDAVSTPVAQGDPAIISLECRDPGTRATVMLAKGLLVVRHSDGFCNTFPLIAPYGHSLEQRPIPWAKAAYLQELRKPVSGFWGVFGSYWGSVCDFSTVRPHYPLRPNGPSRTTPCLETGAEGWSWPHPSLCHSSFGGGLGGATR